MNCYSVGLSFDIYWKLFDLLHLKHWGVVIGTDTRIPDSPFSSFGPSRDYGTDLCICSLSSPPHIYVSKCVYVYVHISLFLPECACTTIIDISPRIFSLMYCCCVSIIFVICICPPGALIRLINLFLFHTDKNKIYKYHFLFYNVFPQMLSGCLILSPYQIYPFGEGGDNGTIVNVTKVNQTLELCLRTRNNDNHP